MSKILLSVLIFTILSSSLCNIFPTNSEYQTSFNNLEDYQQSEKDFIEFLKGANEGFSLFFRLPGEGECKKVNPKAIELARQIFNEIKPLNINNAFNILKSVIPKAITLIDIITKESKGCVAWGMQLSKVFLKLKLKVESAGYKEQAIFHAMINMAPIVDKSVVAVKQFAEKKFYNSGKTGGELMKFIFFWDI
jgi:hypothetical protein